MPDDTAAQKCAEETDLPPWLGERLRDLILPPLIDDEPETSP